MKSQIKTKNPLIGSDDAVDTEVDPPILIVLLIVIPFLPAIDAPSVKCNACTMNRGGND